MEMNYKINWVMLLYILHYSWLKICILIVKGKQIYYFPVRDSHKYQGSIYLKTLHNSIVLYGSWYAL